MKSWKEQGFVVLKVGIALTGFLSTFYTVIDLMFFLSSPNYGVTATKPVPENKSWTWSLIMNTLLVSIFGLQHSLLAMQPVKDFFIDYGIKDIQRSIYIITTCLGLQLLISNWHYTENHVLWQFSMESHSVYWLYVLTHVISWVLIYIGSICLDINELLGIKQVYYSLMGLPDPLSFKSSELQHLYAHMRHPSFIGIATICWFTPVMRYDRILLSAFLTLYMYIAWKTDDTDFHYQKMQITKKFQ